MFTIKSQQNFIPYCEYNEYKKSKECLKNKGDKSYEKDASVPVEWLQGKPQQTPTENI